METQGEIKENPLKNDAKNISEFEQIISKVFLGLNFSFISKYVPTCRKF